MDGNHDGILDRGIDHKSDVIVNKLKPIVVQARSQNVLVRDEKPFVIRTPPVLLYRPGKTRVEPRVVNIRPSPLYLTKKITHISRPVHKKIYVESYTKKENPCQDEIVDTKLYQPELDDLRRIEHDDHYSGLKGLHGYNHGLNLHGLNLHGLNLHGLKDLENGQIVSELEGGYRGLHGLHGLKGLEGEILESRVLDGGCGCLGSHLGLGCGHSLGCGNKGRIEIDVSQHGKGHQLSHLL